ncbi:MAG: undecaprenyl-diphosphate phosphatase [Candidatus Thiodiazotropha sp. (ex Lucinoma kastoroae)]|nr:undecaprenyl-diphosphate phosphatase [Candidatus Thiodiazotropha sp. (ex Rostrolucina anterorostrata)]MCU7848548.1 undecaprenyl-diphosphate phosphatase [Candidatus Thiodiazotropha sp. (ex Lucinoma kastoroae)]MCU7875736.1 undecaprenyl-diphosphate phosphatase [Candidatus Thiodiazotropha sp. (ex Lucinoma borealis)]
MELLQIFILAALQGLTEFLPISSSAHLILAPRVTGYADQGLAFDVAVHVGTLAAVVGYFRHEVITISSDFFRSWVNPAARTKESRLGWMILIATLPVGLFGLLMKSLVETDLRSPMVIAITTIGFGILLLIADLVGKRQRDEYSIRWLDALIIGLFQALAIIPGTSRSGSTITAGLFLGLSRKAASRFSFLISIPTILMSGGLLTLDLIQSEAPADWISLGLGAGLAFITAYLCIHYFLRFIENIGMLPFVIYRIILGGLILLFLL